MDTRQTPQGPVVDIDLNVNIFIDLFSDHTNMQKEEANFNFPNLNVDTSSFVLDLNMESCVEEDDIGHPEEGLHHDTNLNTGTLHSSYNVAFNISLPNLFVVDYCTKIFWIACTPMLPILELHYTLLKIHIVFTFYSYIRTALPFICHFVGVL